MTSRTTSQMSLLLDKSEPMIECKICLLDCVAAKMVSLGCGCQFCDECLGQYTRAEVLAASYSISCPDPGCQHTGTISQAQLSSLLPPDLMDKHRQFRLETEVSLDSSRTWCPAPDCRTVCHVCPAPAPATCPSCALQFCAACHGSPHPGRSCAEAGEGAAIKRCPMCRVPIERDAGCAQMMCRRCKHLFCWYCMASLDGDFLLRHYDSGACRGKLGHSRVSVVLHRLQVLAIFAMFGLLLLVASPLLLALAPVILCCKCGCCSFKKNVKTKMKTKVIEA